MRPTAPLLIAAPLLLLLLSGTAPALAAGVGLTVSGSSGTTDKWFWGGDDRTFESSGAALLIDTARPGRVFGYRLELAFDRVEVDAGVDPVLYPAREIDRISARHTFGFGVINTPAARVWLGPQVLMCRESGTGYRDNGWGFGWAAGGDFHLAPALSLGVTTGARNILTGDNTYDELFLSLGLVFQLKSE